MDGTVAVCGVVKRINGVAISCSAAGTRERDGSLGFRKLSVPLD
jgi:hypothetical protein